MARKVPPLALSRVASWAACRLWTLACALVWRASKPLARASGVRLAGVPSVNPPSLLGGQRVAGTAGNGGRFFLGHGGQDVQGELVGGRQVHGLEAHAAFHQGGQEGHAAGQAVKLGHEQHRAFALGQGDGRRQLGPRALPAALHLDVVRHAHGVGGEEAVHGRLLGFEAQTGLALAGGAHAEVGDVATHGK
jgi:hypothetical protein